MPKKRLLAKVDSTSTLLPVTVDVDLIRFEKNLLQIGFFGANDVRGKGGATRRVEQVVTRDGHRVKVAAEFRGSESLGLPSTTDRDKFIALLKMINEDRTRMGQVQNPFRFSGYRLIQELGLARNGEIYEEILRWGKRMTDTTITSEHVVYFAAKKVYSDETLHVFRSFRRTGTSNLEGGERQEQYEVVLEDWLVENLNQRYVVLEDFSAYKQLTRPTAKGIFGNLHLWFHASQGRPVEKDYLELCNLLNIQAYPHLSKIKSTMGLALNELVNIKYVATWDVAKMVSKKGFKIILTPGDALLNVLDSSRKDRPLPLVESSGAVEATGRNDVRGTMRRLQEFGISQAAAQKLVSRFDESRIISVANYIDAQISSSAGRNISNPAGLLIHCLEEDVPVPLWFTAEDVPRGAVDALDESAAQRRRAEIEYAEWLEMERERAFKDNYFGSELDKQVATTIATHLKFVTGSERWSKDAKTKYALELIWKELRVATAVPSFEEWLLGNAQIPLFISGAKKQ